MYDWLTPKIATGMRTTNPAIGPAMPTSNSARLVRGRPMRMTAPNVPTSVGTGRK